VTTESPQNMLGYIILGLAQWAGGAGRQLWKPSKGVGKAAMQLLGQGIHTHAVLIHCSLSIYIYAKVLLSNVRDRRRSHR
jgi:hypothetical protein